MSQAVPTRGYVICSEHRSGTTLLCRLLASTGRLGRPDEVFRHTEYSSRFERSPEMLAEMLRGVTTENGVYGLKIFSQQFDVTTGSRWPELLPNLSFVHVERHDLLGQAISLVRALQTDQYFSWQAARGEVRYDRHAIARHLGRIAEAQARWRCYFARNGIDPLRLAYEDIVADPAGAVAAVARHAGVTDPGAIDLSQVDLSIQRDAVSEEWRARFVAESADLNYLDHRFGRPRIWLRRLARDVWRVRQGMIRR